jgi:hypothetical protein
MSSVIHPCLHCHSSSTLFALSCIIPLHLCCYSIVVVIPNHLCWHSLAPLFMLLLFIIISALFTLSFSCCPHPITLSVSTAIHSFLVSYSHHQFFTMSSKSSPCPSSPMDADAEAWLQDHMHQRFAEITMDFEPTVPSTDPPQPLQPQEEAGPSNSPEFLPQVFMGTPISLPTIPQTPAMDTLARGAETIPLPRHFPPGAKLAKKQALSKHTDLSVFDILNIFQCRWFLSVGHLQAQALSAQKADNGKIFWVEFTPQFHAHLVKCAVALVPRPILKVKKVMFVYILELLNEEGNQAFFDLSKGDRWASAAQKEKKRLAWKRNCTSRQECQKQAEEAVEGCPQWSCVFCGCKFTLHKTAKRH